MGEESKSFYILKVKSFIKSSSLSLKKRSLSKFLKFYSNMSFLKSSSLSVKKKKSLYDFQVPFKPVFHQVIKSFVEEKRCISKISWNQVFFLKKKQVFHHIIKSFVEDMTVFKSKFCKSFITSSSLLLKK